MKDLAGLIKYLLIMFPMVFIPIVLGYLILLSFYPIFTFLTIFILGVYLVMPIAVTIKALENHWSKYLDFFLNNIFLLTLFLILLFKGLFGVDNNSDMVRIFNFETRTSNIVVPCMFIAPVYFLVYITAVIYKIKNSKLFKNKNHS